jgi:hypothetical protein
MSSSIPSPTHEPNLLSPVPGEGAPSSPLRLAMLRSIAAAHVLAGALEFLKVAGNLLLRLPYTDGTLALPGRATVLLARVLYDLSQGQPLASPNWVARTEWIRVQADTTGSFLVAMMAAHTVLGMLNVGLGLGLWRRQSWARWLDVVALGLATLFAVAHLAAWFRVSGHGTICEVLAVWFWVSGHGTISELIVEALRLVAPAFILAFLISPRTGDIFAIRDDALPARRKRQWWTLSLQGGIGILTAVLGLILVALFDLGPMAEIVGIAAQLTLDRP